MKNLLLAAILLISTLHTHAQFRKEFLGELPSDFKKFPQSHLVYFNYRYDNYNYVQVIDSITGQYLTKQNTGQYKKYQDDQEYVFAQFDGYFLGYEQEENAPPLLDSLEDGIYVMYYSTIPIANKDTVEFRSNIVSAIIPIVNNKAHGVVKWYFSNGLLKQETNYVNGEKQGASFFQDVYSLTEMSLPFVHVTQMNYTKNSLDGEFISYLELNPVFEGKKRTNLLIKTTSNYVKGSLDGEIEFRINDQIIFSGFYKEDKPSSKWEIYDWKIKNQKVVVTLRTKFEINDEEQLLKEEYFHRTTFNKNPRGFEDYNISSINRAGERRKAYMHFHFWQTQLPTYDFKNNENIFTLSEFDEISYLSDCENLGSIPKNYIRTNEIPRDFSYALTDKTGNNVLIEDVAKICGTVFDFKNYTEYYPNGQLRCSFDFSKPEELYASKVYYPDGKVMNEVKIENGIYHQYWYDSIGKLLEHSTHESNGKFIELVESSKFKTIDGFYCKKVGDEWQFPGKTAYNLDQDTAFVYKASFNQNLKLSYIHRHDPKTGKGRIEKYDGENAFLVNDYFIDKERHKVTYDCRMKIGDLTISKNQTYNLDSIQYLNGIYDSVTWQLLNYLEYWSNDYLHTAIVYEKGKPCTKPFKIVYGNNEKLRITSTKKLVTIYCSDKYSSLMVNFLSSIETFLGSNYVTNKNDYLSDEHYKKLTLKTLEFSLVDGEIAGNIQRTSACGFPLETIYLNEGITIQYNGYPQLHFTWEQDETHNYGDSVYSYVSLISKHKANEYSSITTFNALGKLTGFDSTNYVTKESFTNHQADFIGSSSHKKDSIYLNYTLNYVGEEFNYFEYNKEKNLCQEYDEEGRIIKNYRITDGRIDHITTYDTLSNITSEIKLINGYMEFQTNYKNGFISSTQSFDLKDSVQPILQKFPHDLDKTLFVWDSRIKTDHGYMNPRSSSTEYLRSYTKIYQNNQVVAEGELHYSAKQGLWKYSYSNQLPYTIEYRDTFVSGTEGLRFIRFSNYKDPLHNLMCHGTIAKIKWYSASNALFSEGMLYEFDKEYTCLQDAYTEQFLIDYSLYNSKPTAGTTEYIVNYYPNGNKMNEGTIVNGKPDGLWKWYHNDGLLYEVGKYKNGVREGRWLKGDLSKIRFMGETCLNEESNDYNEMLKHISVTITYFEKGEPGLTIHHDLQTGE